MTDSRQRGVGSYQLSDQQVTSWLSWMDEECLERKARELLAELESARYDFAAELPWHPNNAYHLCDWWEQLSKYYAMRARAEVKRADRLAAGARLAWWGWQHEQHPDEDRIHAAEGLGLLS